MRKLICSSSLSVIHKLLLTSREACLLWHWGYIIRAEEISWWSESLPLLQVSLFMYCGMIFITDLPMKRQGMFVLDGSLLCSMHTAGGWEKRRVCDVEIETPACTGSVYCRQDDGSCTEVRRNHYLLLHIVFGRKVHNFSIWMKPDCSW